VERREVGAAQHEIEVVGRGLAAELVAGEGDELVDVVQVRAARVLRRAPLGREVLAKRREGRLHRGRS